MDESSLRIMGALEHASRKLFSDDERDQIHAIKDLWSLSCDDPQFAIAIGQSTPLLRRLLHLCSLASSSNSFSSGGNHTDGSSGSMRPSWKLVILALHCVWNLSAYEENKPTVVLQGDHPRAESKERITGTYFCKQIDFFQVE